jgi:metallo-beta-lactamase class B
MKLHLPKSLRNSVLACIAAVAGVVSSTVGSATFAGGYIAFALSGQANAATYTDPTTTFANGDVLELGNTKITFMHTPGHTKGTISFFFDMEVDGKTYLAGMFGGAGANTLTNTSKGYYPTARRDYFASIEKLRGEKVEVMIGNHTWNNDTLGKGELIKSGCKENPFVDTECSEWNKFLDFCEQRCRNLEEKEGKEV